MVLKSSRARESREVSSRKVLMRGKVLTSEAEVLKRSSHMARDMYQEEARRRASGAIVEDHRVHLRGGPAIRALGSAWLQPMSGTASSSNQQRYELLRGSERRYLRESKFESLGCACRPPYTINGERQNSKNPCVVEQNRKGRILRRGQSDFSITLFFTFLHTHIHGCSC